MLQMVHIRTRILIKDCKGSARASRGNLSQSEKHHWEAAVTVSVGLTVFPLSTGFAILIAMCENTETLISRLIGLRNSVLIQT